MYIDSQETFAEGQSVAAAAGDIVSTNVYDTGAAADVGIGEPMFVYANLVTALAGTGSVQVVLQHSSDNSAFTDVASGPATTVANGKIGTRLAAFALPMGLKRYLRVAFRVAGGTTSGGTASAYLVDDVHAQQYLKSGISPV